MITIRIHSLEGANFGTLSLADDGTITPRPTARGERALAGILRMQRPEQSGPAFLHWLMHAMSGQVDVERNDWAADPHGHQSLEVMDREGGHSATLRMDGDRLHVVPRNGMPEHELRERIEQLRSSHWSDRDLFHALPELLGDRVKGDQDGGDGPQDPLEWNGPPAAGVERPYHRADAPRRHNAELPLHGPLVSVHHPGYVHEDYGNFLPAGTHGKFLLQAARAAGHSWAHNQVSNHWTTPHDDGSGSPLRVAMLAAPTGKVVASTNRRQSDFPVPPEGYGMSEHLTEEPVRLSRPYAHVRFHPDPGIQPFLKAAIAGGEAEARILADRLRERGRDDLADRIEGVGPDGGPQLLHHGPAIAGALAEVEDPFQRDLHNFVGHQHFPWHPLSHEEAVQLITGRARDEIRNDIKAGRVPESVQNFSQLHDHVDANGYGGAFDWIPSDTDAAENPYSRYQDRHHRLWNDVQDSLDRWLRAGGHRRQAPVPEQHARQSETPATDSWTQYRREDTPKQYAGWLSEGGVNLGPASSPAGSEPSSPVVPAVTARDPALVKPDPWKRKQFVVDLDRLEPHLHEDVHRLIGHYPRALGIHGGYLLDEEQFPGKPGSLLGSEHAKAAVQLTQNLKKLAGRSLEPFRPPYAVHVDLSKLSEPEKELAHQQLARLPKLPGHDDLYESPGGGMDLQKMLPGGARVSPLFATAPTPGTKEYGMVGEPPKMAETSPPTHPIIEYAASQTQSHRIAAEIAPYVKPVTGPLRSGPITLPRDLAGASLIPIVNAPFPDDFKMQKASQADIVYYILNRSQQSLGGMIDLDHPDPRTRTKNRQRAMNLMAAEAFDALSKHGDAVQWYKSSVRNSVALAKALFPKLRESGFHLTAYLLGLAITSQGQPIGINSNSGEFVFNRFADAGQMPEDFGRGKSKQAMMDNFRLFNTMVREWGPDRLTNFLTKEQTVREINDEMFTIIEAMGGDPNKDKMVSGELADFRALGAIVFGPKIGNGFFGNLNGDWSRLTMDMWYMRMVGRHTGTLMAHSPGEVEAKVQRFRRALHAEGLLTRSLLNEPALLLTEADRIHKKYASGNYKDKTELNKAAKGLDELLYSPVDVPSGGSQRQTFRDIASGVLNLLKKSGETRLDMADLQALHWYPEKELWEKLGYQDKRSRPDSYDHAMRRRAVKEGYTKEQIRSILEDAGHTWGPKDEADWNRGNWPTDR